MSQQQIAFAKQSRAASLPHYHSRSAAAASRLASRELAEVAGSISCLYHRPVHWRYLVNGPTLTNSTMGRPPGSNSSLVQSTNPSSFGPQMIPPMSNAAQLYGSGSQLFLPGPPNSNSSTVSGMHASLLDDSGDNSLFTTRYDCRKLEHIILDDPRLGRCWNSKYRCRACILLRSLPRCT